MSYEYSEDALIEQATEDVLKELGWAVLTAWTKESFGENGLLGRDNKSEVILKRYVIQALEKLNPELPSNVYKQLEQAYSVYGEGTKGRTPGEQSGKPVEQLAELEVELKKAITEVKEYLSTLNFKLSDLYDVKPMEKIGLLKKATDCICLNETTRTSFEMMARNVFRKYKALFPEEQVKPHVKAFNAIDAIYSLLNQNVKTADVTEIMMQLQSIVNESVYLDKNKVADQQKEVYIDLSKLDFDKLKAAFAKAPNKNTLVYNLQQSIDKKLQQMLKENPLRLDFYERYKEIIDEYNKGKSIEDVTKTLKSLADFIIDLSEEEKRAVRENLTDQETLAIFDLLREGKELRNEELEQVKKVAKETLDKLKAEKLKIERWRESRQITAQVKGMIYDNLLWLPQIAYSDEEISLKTVTVYQHIYSNYYGGGNSVYRASV